MCRCCRNTIGSFSPIFLDRVYEEHLVSHKTCRAEGYPNQMDFGAFLDFMLAWDNRSSLAGIQYLFPVLDLKGRGYLSQVWVTLAKTLLHEVSERLSR
jgi:serine/threonine-protein phosphatase 2A regulatory subunit B''